MAELIEAFAGVVEIVRQLLDITSDIAGSALNNHDLPGEIQLKMTILVSLASSTRTLYRHLSAHIGM